MNKFAKVVSTLMLVVMLGVALTPAGFNNMVINHVAKTSSTTKK